MKDMCKIVLLAYIGENIVEDMSNEKAEYRKVRKALDFCWKWIEDRQVNEELIYEFLDDEDEDDLVGYMIYENNAIEKKKYGVILGIVSCVSVNVLESNKSPIPQFLSGTDDRYYELLMKDINELGMFTHFKEKMDKVYKYCINKVKNNDLQFTKLEVMNV